MAVCVPTASWPPSSCSRRVGVSPPPSSPTSWRSPSRRPAATSRRCPSPASPCTRRRDRGGGWSLVGGARTDLSGLTAAEARTLFLVAGPSSTATPDAKAALRKLVQALPETFRADAEAAASAIVLDPAGWGGTSRPRPVHLDVLQRAVVEGVQVRLGYADRERNETVRTVHPLGLVDKGSVWYLVAGTEAGMRTFRVSRVRSVEPTDDPVVRPVDFDLGETWQRVVTTMEERRTSVRAIVRIDRHAASWLRGQFGASVEVLGEADDGRVEVEIGAPSVEMLAEHLAGWGGRPEVVAPEEVRAAPAAPRARAGRPLRPGMTEVTRPVRIHRPGPCRMSDVPDRLADVSDAVVALAIARYDQEALAEAYRRHAGAVFGLARRLLIERALAEEIVQEVFLRLWNDPTRFDPERGTMRSYLLTQTHGRAVDLLRADTSRRAREERDARRTAEGRLRHRARGLGPDHLRARPPLADRAARRRARGDRAGLLRRVHVP